MTKKAMDGVDRHVAASRRFSATARELHAEGMSDEAIIDAMANVLCKAAITLAGPDATALFLHNLADKVQLRAAEPAGHA